MSASPMAARFVHIGDLHLGPNARNGDRRAALDQILDENGYGPVSAWLWPGDLNDGRQTIEDKNYLTERVYRMAGIAPVVIVPGNHDLPGELDYLSYIGAFYPIYVVNTPQVLRVNLAWEGGDSGQWASIFCLPYPHRAGLIAAGVATEDLGQAARAALEAIFRPAITELRDAQERSEITLMIGHVNVGGSIMSAGQPNIGREIELDPALLAPFGDIPILLNHVHKAQTVGQAWYAGSCCRLDWGEVEEKRYLVLEWPITPGGYESAWRIEAKPLHVAPMFHIEGTLTREGFTWTAPEGARPCPACQSAAAVPPCAVCEGRGYDWTGTEVRVRYAFDATVKDALDESQVRAAFAGAKVLKVEPIPQRTRPVRAPEVAAAVSIHDKAAAFARHAGLHWSPGLETKLALLQLPDGGAFLTDVTRSLAESAPDGPAAAERTSDRAVDSVNPSPVHPVQ